MFPILLYALLWALRLLIMVNLEAKDLLMKHT